MALPRNPTATERGRQRRFRPRGLLIWMCSHPPFPSSSDADQAAPTHRNTLGTCGFRLVAALCQRLGHALAARGVHQKCSSAPTHIFFVPTRRYEHFWESSRVADAGFIVNKSMPPPEWAQQEAVWTCWPSAPDLWQEDLEPARLQVAAMVRHLSRGTPRVCVLASGERAYEDALQRVGDVASIYPATFGDIWLRDTGPILVPSGNGWEARRFVFNGWGGKYRLEGDTEVGDWIAAEEGFQATRFPFVLEGGAVDWDGEGTLLTTRQCLLNPNRNEGWTEAQTEAALRSALGAEKTLWLDEGLQNDHTDGHVDNLARFIEPGHVVCQAPAGEDDPNQEVLRHIQRTLEQMTDARGRVLRVTTIPSPGRITGEDGNVQPASHMNFLIGNDTVLVPTYGASSTEPALQALQTLFPTREVVGLPADAILSGGGAFHCITQQQPALRAD